jgi:DNA-3-methyladenine glycosylase I
MGIKLRALPRCGWAVGSLYEAYHDREWGRPIYDDRILFEFLILEGAQAGLSWITILKKREAYRKAFARFDPKKVARFNQAKQNQLLKNQQLVRNRLKIKSAVTNAKAFLMVQAEFGSFSRYIWQFVDNQPVLRRRKNLAAVPARTPESDALSQDLKRRGFKFVGSTICYAFMQACGLVDDHVDGCYRSRRKVRKPLRVKKN